MKFPAKNPSRLVQLDVLRGIAILLVLGHHPALDTQEAGFLEPFATWWWHFGWTGVDLFFVLSGFLIGGLLLKELQLSGRLDVVRFLIRRAFKIWPAYLLFLFLPVTIPLAKLVLLSQGTLSAIATQYAGYMLPSLFQLQNYFGTMPGRLHTWSLAVEEHFYLILPLLLLWLTRRKGDLLSWFPLITFLIALVSLFLRIAHWNPDFAGPTHLRLDSLFFGVFLAYVYYFKPQTWQRLAQHRRLLFVGGVLLTSPMMFLDYSDPLVWTVGYSLLYLGFGCILVAISQPPGVESTSRFWNSPMVRLVAWVGYFSYTTYLWHLDFGQLPAQKLVVLGLFNGMDPAIRWAGATTLYIVFATVAGMVMGMLVEKPGLYLRERFFPSKSVAMPKETIQ